MRVGKVWFLLILCSACTAQPGTQNSSAENQSAAAAPDGDPGFIAEDPALAKHVGQPGPALTLKTIDGKSINLADLYGKRPVYLKLWATYCIPCRVQMPGLNKIFAEHGRDMAVIAINAGVGDDVGKVTKFSKDFSLKMPVAIDDGRLGEWIGMDATPVHLVFGRDGRVIFAGHQDGPKLDAAIDQALSSKAAPGNVATDELADFVALKPGDMIPRIDVQTSAGRLVDLPTGPAPHLRAIYFSATWCESYVKTTQPDEAAKCQRGREEVDKLAADRSIQWFGVMTHLWTTPGELAVYEAGVKTSIPLAVDSSGAAFRTFGVRRFPAVALIDTQGRLVKLIDGDPKEFASEISSLRATK